MIRTDFRRRILSANDATARENRRRFDAAGVLVLDVISSPGSGKTTLLCETAERLRGTLRLGAVVGDVATELDADRLRGAGLPAKQIVTGGACHLDAKMIAKAVPDAALEELDVLFVENVGNLVCPATYDLGEDRKICLLSVTEGHDKPFKYPAAFTRSGVVVLTKSDLAPHVPFEREVAREQILSLNPKARILELSALRGEGMDAWCELLRSLSSEKRRPSRA